MGIVMNMGSYEIDRNEALETEYSEEVLCSGWNPALVMACQQATPPLADGHLTIPSSLTSVDPEAFLQKMYAWQR